MSIGLWLVVVWLLFLLIQYHWRRLHLYKLAAKFPGPPALPIVGNGLLFTSKKTDVLKVIDKVSKRYKKPLRFWFGHTLLLYFTDADHFEKILSSPKVATKHDIFNVIKFYMREGLHSRSEHNHIRHRKLIQSLLNANFLSESMDIFQKHIHLLLEKLFVHSEGEPFDVYCMIHLCVVDIIGESLLGTQMKGQNGQNMQFIQASRKAYTVAFKRLITPWYHPNCIQNITNAKQNQARLNYICYNFIKNCVAKSLYRVRIKKEIDKKPVSPLIDQIADLTNKDITIMNEKDFIRHMFSMYLAIEDSMTLITSMLCVCFGMYPEYQKIAAEEIRSVCGEVATSITYDHLSKLSYLDMCIKDVLRIFPVYPIIARKPIEDFEIDGIAISKDCGIVLSIFELHRNPKYWENPEHFHPDHFLPEAIQKRHPFAFVPFGSEPYGCIGNQFAFFGLKLTMLNILQRFEIEADGKLPDVLLKLDVTLRSLSGYKIRLKKRVWE